MIDMDSFDNEGFYTFSCMSVVEEACSIAAETELHGEGENWQP